MIHAMDYDFWRKHSNFLPLLLVLTLQYTRAGAVTLRYFIA